MKQTSAYFIDYAIRIDSPRLGVNQIWSYTPIITLSPICAT